MSKIHYALPVLKHRKSSRVSKKKIVLLSASSLRTIPRILCAPLPTLYVSRLRIPSAYSIKKLKGKIDGLSISLCGDLRYGRTVHSLGMALSYYDVNIKLAAPPTLRMKPAIIDEMKKAGVRVTEVDTVEEAVQDVDVVYMTRIQKERFPDVREFDDVKGKFRITSDEIGLMKDDAIVLHPLPRVDELASEIDSTPHAKYFDQVYSGVVTRMAILKLIFG